MLRLLNKDRKFHGLQPVRMQEDLRAVARKHSKDMADKDYFDHVNLRFQSPSDRLRLAGVSDVVSGENLAKIGGFQNATQVAEEGLMNSPGHRANILNAAYNTVGIGVIQSRTKVYYFTQNFAHRDLIFYNKISSKVHLRKGLLLKGEGFSDIKNIYYEIRLPHQENVLLKKIIPLKNRKFRFHIVFPEIGVYETWLYVEHKQNKKPGYFTLANKFQVTVRKGWLW